MCGDDSINKNQEEIHKKLFRVPENFSKISIPVTIENGLNFELTLPDPNHKGEEIVKLDSCFENSVAVKYAHDIEYFTKLLGLFAGMCAGKNYLNTTSISNWFSRSSLIYNMWNKVLSTKLRAGFSKLFKAIYIDSYSKIESKRLETVKILEIHYKKKSFQKFMKIESPLDISSLYLKAIEIQGDEESDDQTLHGLKEDIIQYFVDYHYQKFDELTLELLNITYELTKFEIIGLGIYLYETKVLINECSDVRFRREDTGIYRLLNVIDQVLFSNADKHRFKTVTMKLKSARETAETGNSDRNQQKYERGIAKEVKDPVGIEGDHVLGYFKIFLNPKSDAESYEDIEIQCKIKLLQIMELIIDWRQDRLATNILEWFKQAIQKDQRIDNKDDLISLLPPIIEIDHNQIENHKFKKYDDFDIPDLAWLGKDLIKKLLKLFTTTDDYKMQSFILKIIMRSFSQRASLVKTIEKLLLITNNQDSDLFNWLKVNMAMFTQLSRQSEIWIEFYKAAPDSQRSIKKYEKIIRSLKNFEIILSENSIIENGKPCLPDHSAKVSSSRQSLVVHLNLHLKIISFVRDSIHNLDLIYDDPKSDNESEGREKLIELFTLSFNVLTKIVKSNKQNQKVLYRYLNVFTKDLKMSLGQSTLISEIFRDNYELCSEIDEKFLGLFVNLIEKEGRQARFLELFSVVQVVEGQPVHELQRLVFNALAQNPHSQYFLYLDSQGKLSYDRVLDSLSPSYLDEPILYHCKIIETIANCAIGTKNIYSIEVKCQKLFSVQLIFDVLQASEASNTQSMCLRIPTLKLFYFAYIETDKYIKEIFRNKLLIEYIKKNTGNTNDSLEFIEIMIEILAGYTDKYIKSERHVYDFFDDFDAIEKFVQTISNYSEKFRFSSKTLSSIEILKNYYDFEVLGYDQIIISESSVINNETDRVMNQWILFKNQFIYTDLLRNHIKSERKALMSIIVNIKNYLKGISLEEFLRKIVNYIRKTQNKTQSNEILLYCIHFIISILSEASMSQEDISKEQIQNKLCELGLIKIILTIICSKNCNKKIYERLVDLSIQMLDGGNHKVQTEYYQYFTLSDNSQEFFRKCYDFINSEKNVNEDNLYKVYKNKKDYIIKVLRLIQLLCENHNSDLQNYLRYQGNSTSNYNIIESTVFLFEKLLTGKQYSSFLVMSQCIDTLTELIQGPCEGNQKALLSHKFLEVSAGLLKTNQQDELLSHYNGMSGQDNITGQLLKGWMIVHLKYKLSITLLSLLEMNQDDYIISLIFRTIHDKIIEENLKSMYKNYLELYDPEEYRSEIFNHFKHNEKFRYNAPDNPQDTNEAYYLCIIELGFNLYHLKSYLKDYERKIKNITTEDYIFQSETADFFGKDFLRDIYNFFIDILKKVRQMSKKISGKRNFSDAEILKNSNKFFEDHTGRIEVALEDGKIIKVYFTLQPESLYLSPEIKNEFHKSVDRTSEKSKLQYLQMSNIDLMLEIQNEQRLDFFFKKYALVSIITSNVRLWYSLGFMVTLFLNIMLVSSYNAPFNDPGFQPRFCLSSDQYGYCNDYMSAERTNNFFQVIGTLHVTCGALVLFFQVLKAGPKLHKKYSKEYSIETDSKIIKLGYASFAYIRTAIDLQISYYCGYFIISLIAITGNLYLLYSLHLIDVIYRFPSLQNVVKSVYYSINSLAITYIFIIVLIYYFTLWGYSRLSASYLGQCDDLYVCMINTYDKGLKLGMGWVLGEWTPGTFNIERLFFDNLYYLMILIMMMNFIKGIIFDAFFLLKDEDDTNEWDKKNLCFVCGTEREEIENLTQRSFRYHVEREHNEWNYAFYIMYLDNKYTTEYTSVETYVRNCLDTNSLAWYPQKAGVSFSLDTKKDTTQLEDQIYHIKQQLSDFKNELEEFVESNKDNNKPN